MWKKTKKPLEIFIVTVGCVVVIVLVVLIALTYIFNVNIPGLAGKNLWDWMQLLIIPAVLAVGGYWFNYATSRTEREIASDKQREDALQAYIDSMSALLLDKDLSKLEEVDKVGKVARVRTLTVLPRLDGKRKASVLQFLYESEFIVRGSNLVDLSGADLDGALLNGADLTGASLREANLRGAFLLGASLFGADLYKTHLTGAHLGNSYLHGADLRESDLRGADLSMANLGAYSSPPNEADLSGAMLNGADLRGANYTDEQLKQARTLRGAILRDGRRHP